VLFVCNVKQAENTICLAEHHNGVLLAENSVMEQKEADPHYKYFYDSHSSGTIKHIEL
jgi:hypothetical protein